MRILTSRQAGKEKTREKGERKGKRKRQIFFCKFLFFRSGVRKTRGKKGKCKRWVCNTYLDEFLTWSSPATAPEILLLRRQRSSVVSWACVGFSLEEERAMQHSSSKYCPQFENQGINPVGVSSQVSKVPAQKQQTCTQRYKEVVNLFTIDCKVRFEGGKGKKVNM